MVIIVPEKLSAVLVGYRIEGTALLALWGGGEGNIEMSPKNIYKQTIEEDDIKEAINDAGFGCEKITNAIVQIYGIYRPILPDSFKGHSCDSFTLFLKDKYFEL